MQYVVTREEIHHSPSFVVFRTLKRPFQSWFDLLFSQKAIATRVNVHHAHPRWLAENSFGAGGVVGIWTCQDLRDVGEAAFGRPLRTKQVSTRDTTIEFELSADNDCLFKKQPRFAGFLAIIVCRWQPTRRVPFAWHGWLVDPGRAVGGCLFYG